jgi:hypothetical protein
MEVNMNQGQLHPKEKGKSVPLFIFTFLLFSCQLSALFPHLQHYGVIPTRNQEALNAKRSVIAIRAPGVLQNRARPARTVFVRKELP